MFLSKSGALCAAAFALSFAGLSAHAGVIKNAGSASTSNTSVSTTTSGQKSILTTIDPYNIAGITVNGRRQTTINLTVDGISDLDPGSMNGNAIAAFRIPT